MRYRWNEQTRQYRDDLHADGGGNIFVACQIAHKFCHRVPAIAELRECYGMSRATAYRWLAAIKAARGAA